LNDGSGDYLEIESFFIKRDFLREAVFFLIMPRLAALSIAFWTFGKSFRASSGFLAEINFLYSLTTLCSWFLRFKLKTFFLLEERSAFLADDVIGIFSN